MSEINRLFGHVSNEKGAKNEQRVLDAFATNRPNWIDSVEPASKKQDNRGIDIVFNSDVGKLYLQVKSSIAGKKHFKRTQEENTARNNIAVVILRPETDVRAVVIEAISKLRENYLARRANQQKNEESLC